MPMNIFNKIILLSFAFIGYLSIIPSPTIAINEPTLCEGTVVDLSTYDIPNFSKKLLSIRDLARPGNCGIKPTKIVVHTTQGVETVEAQFEDFENQTRGASTAFMVGKDGQVMQMLELLEDKAEIGWGVGNYNSHAISIEVGRNGNYESRDEAPPEQYESLLKLIAALMQVYSIPVGDVEYDTVNTGDSPGDGPIDASTLGIFGHYQLNPSGKTDPGRGFLRDVREDIKEGGPFISRNTSGGGGSRSDTDCLITQVGEPTTEKPPLPPECSDSGGSGLPGQPLPSDDPTEIKRVLCEDYKVCPTVTANASSQPDQDWTLNQLTALWNVVQKIYASDTYKAYAIGNTTLEVTRAACYPGGCDDTMGYYANRAYTSWNAMSGTRLVIATNNVPKDGPMAKIEWLLAHEIGHGASGGSSDGNFLDCIDCNEPTNALKACGEAVSGYAKDGEYVPEAISYYMTAAEEVNDYNGDDNMKTDFPCLYNAAKDGFFGGVEY